MILEERYLCATAINNPKVTSTVVLAGEAFHDPRLGAIWDAITDMSKTGGKPNPTWIVQHASRRGVRVTPDQVVDLVGETPVGAPEDWSATVLDNHDRESLQDAMAHIRQMLETGAPTADVRAKAADLLGPGQLEQVADRLMSLGEFASQQLPPTEWVMPDLLARGDRVIITGSEGLGKSTLIREIAVCAAAGFDPFTRENFPPVKVLAVDLENPKSIMVPRFHSLAEAVRKYGRNADDRLWIERRPQGMDVSQAEDRMHLHHLCSLVNPDLLVIGPAYKMHRGGSRDREEDLARQVTSVLDELRERYGFALLLEHHSPHAATDGRRSPRPIGSSLWLRWPEFGFGIVPSQGFKPSDRVVDVVHWRGMRDERPWPESLESGGISGLPWVDPNPRPRQATA